MASGSRYREGITDISNLLDSDEYAEKLSDTNDSELLATDDSSDTDFHDQEDIYLLDIGGNSDVGDYAYVTDINFLWEDTNIYVRHRKIFTGLRAP
jgi:hypothetical protein